MGRFVNMPSAHSLIGISLQSFALKTRELGTLVSPVMLTCRQVWVAQAP